MMHFICPECGAQLTAAPHMARKRLSCGQCREVVLVPNASHPEEAVAQTGLIPWLADGLSYTTVAELPYLEK